MNILITGAASGIGEKLKDYYLNHGHFVYAIDVLKINPHENLFSYEVSITDKDALTKIKNKLEENKVNLDIIINVAGIHKMASLVENNYDELKKVIDINLLGTMLVNNIFHSLLKKDGRIIIVTSEVASFDPLPFNGLYNVSKTALDCYAQALRQELNLIGQKVITIRPGAIKTKLSDNSLLDTQKLASETKLYKKQSNKFLNLTKKFMGKPLNPEKLAKYIYNISIKKSPKYIYKKHQNIGLLLLSILPKKVQCFVIKIILNS